MLLIHRANPMMKSHSGMLAVFLPKKIQMTTHEINSYISRKAVSPEKIILLAKNLLRRKVNPMKQEGRKQMEK